ncbi:hypothetical protein BDB00DRAFT_105827 [Zychaea mexicana]|uniref:uncharacterized protein n=1 Tax=Zychaea mexicana TaxID=64656 RepID=UPI0022FE1A8A|nr:uncharacterized protein BDB00DRAFT_105827 [Zychaea mexicana]KAI9496734.1 hypothetical protein BDB00DRAFT_105827 [Zychaea mexicana]
MQCLELRKKKLIMCVLLLQILFLLPHPTYTCTNACELQYLLLSFMHPTPPLVHSLQSTSTMILSDMYDTILNFLLDESLHNFQSIIQTSYCISRSSDS